MITLTLEMSRSPNVGVGSTVVGDDVTFIFTGRNAAGAAESIEGDALAFRAWDELGNEIRKNSNDGITTLTQSGITLGQAHIFIPPADYPQAWFATPFREFVRINIEVKRITAAGLTRTPVQNEWRVYGSGLDAADVPAINNYLLLQNGSRLLLQDGGRLILN